MAFRRKKKPLPPERTALKATSNPLAEIDDGLSKNYQRKSNDLIYESVMRSGGEPFFEPLGVGVSSLTDRIVRFFKQRGFFSFETFESRRQKRRNKFTRYGAAPYRGSYKVPRKPKG